MWQFRKTVKFIIRNDLISLTVIRVEPDRADFGIESALNIGCQTVSDDHSCFFVKIWYFGEAAVKVFNAWFVITEFFRNENILEVSGDIGAFEAAFLDAESSVCYKIHAVFSIKSFQKFFCTVHKIMTMGEQEFIDFGGFFGRGINVLL